MLGVVVLIKLLGLLPAASRIKSIEFAKVKASFGGTKYVALFFLKDKASRRIFIDGGASRRKGHIDPNIWGCVQGTCEGAALGAWDFLESLFDLAWQYNSRESWKTGWKVQKELLLRGKEK